MTALLELRHLTVEYAARDRRAPAVDDLSLAISRGETLALVGESGCGKTSVGRAILRLLEPTAGSILFDGEDVRTMRGDVLQRFRRRAQVVFQDPNASLDPRMRIGEIVREGIDIHALMPRPKAELRVAHLLEEVGLPASTAARFPHECSGGERQRIAIARALAVEPEFLILDEAVSALDVLVRQQVLQLLATLQSRRKLTYLFIAHDLAVVERVATRVAVMHRGRLVECAPTRQLFSAPAADATRALLAAIPRIPWETRASGEGR
ncbi:MAG: ATP-binding cassette domain-containing protein [Gemmatimonadota bacterium]|nr:ATP-binding cassette domain-containing protein [Gemmatimonadota bacterium]